MLQLFLGRVAIDGAISAGSHTLNSDLALFTSDDVGREVDVLGAGPGGLTLTSTITAVGSGSSVTLADAASTSRAPGPDDAGATLTVWCPYAPSYGSITCNGSLSNRDTMSFAAERCRNTGAALQPVVGRPVLLKDTVFGDQFGGMVNEVKISHRPGNFSATYECQCVSWDAIASRRSTGQQNNPGGGDPINGKFSGMAAGGIFQWLADHCIGSDMSKAQVVTGPTIPEITFDYTDVGQAFDSVCQAATGDDTYIWRTDARRNLYFDTQATTAAPWDVVDSDALQSYGLTWTLEKYANRAIVTPKDSSGDTIDNTLVRTYQVDDAVADRSSIEGGTGFYETTVSQGDANSSVDGATLAESLAKTYSQVPKTVEYSTFRGGLRAGMSQSITMTDLGITGAYLIDSVDMSTDNGVPLWSIHAVSGALIGDWRTAIAELSGGGVLSIGGFSSTGSDTGVVTIDGSGITY